MSNKMRCPVCGGTDNICVDSRPVNHDAKRRRRKCNCCGVPFSTYEIYDFEYRLLRAIENTNNRFTGERK